LSSSPQAVGTLELALANAAHLLQTNPQLAIEQAEEILRSAPGSPHARLILGQAWCALGDAAAAIGVLEPLAQEQPRSSRTHFELGGAYSAAGRLAEAIRAFQAAAAFRPDWPDVWRSLADHLDAAGESARADQARAAYLGTAVHDPRLRSAAAALRANALDRAEGLLRAHLKEHDTDIAALRMLAEVATRLRRYRDAQTLLERCLELAPSFRPAQHQLAVVLFRLARAQEARVIVERLLQEEPANLGYLSLMAAICAHLGDTADSIDVYERILSRVPGNPKIWLSLGHALKSAGRSEDCVQAYRKSIALEPRFGEAYWSLANLKTYKIPEPDLVQMERALHDSSLSDEDRLHFDFALGKALEDRQRYEDSFRRYDEGARIRHRLHDYRPEETAAYVRRCKAQLTADFFACRAGGGSAAADPIFIVGMPRSGSTLLEQILSSHSRVEGTMELANIPSYARELGEHVGSPQGASGYPEILTQLTDEERQALGERFLAETRVQRKSAAPFFIDKLPNNFLHVGLIHLILPNARVIDARRHPMACCFSNFKQHFARGQNFSYSLEDVGRFYRDYVELMAHFDHVLPGRVHRVIYEQLVEDPEREVRRLLEYCGLSFEDSCLRFYENDRAVRTASSEQVRQPIFRSGVDHWLNFEPWLGPLKQALGPVLDQYPSVPEF
jgi:predicted Zn-dependent protease